LRKGRCWKCKEQFQREDRIVGLFLMYKGKTMRANYHWDCLKELVDTWFILNPFQKERRKRKGKAHPELIPMRRRLMSLRYYHIQHHNQDRVNELTEEINKITIQS
jgi:hypothetical protein